jgi:hypothetical protein
MRGTEFFKDVIYRLNVNIYKTVAYMIICRRNWNFGLKVLNKEFQSALSPPPPRRLFKIVTSNK